MITFEMEISLTNDAAHFFNDLAAQEETEIYEIFESILENYYLDNKGEEE